MPELWYSKKDRIAFEKAMDEAAESYALENRKQKYRERLENIVAQRLRDYDHMTVLQRREVIIDSMDTLDAIDTEMEKRFTQKETKEDSDGGGGVLNDQT